MSPEDKRTEDVEYEMVLELIPHRLGPNELLDLAREIVLLLRLSPDMKIHMMNRLLAENSLSPEIRITYLRLFLDESTKYCIFTKESGAGKMIDLIFESILKYCPNIETLNLTEISISLEYKDSFKRFLIKCTSLKYLRVQCGNFEGVIWPLIIDNDPELQRGLRTIVEVYGPNLDTFACNVLYSFLPNLQSVDNGLPIYNEDSDVVDYDSDNEDDHNGYDDDIDSHNSVDESDNESEYNSYYGDSDNDNSVYTDGDSGISVDDSFLSTYDNNYDADEENDYSDDDDNNNFYDSDNDDNNTVYTDDDDYDNDADGNYEIEEDSDNAYDDSGIPDMDDFNTDEEL